MNAEQIQQQFPPEVRKRGEAILESHALHVTSKESYAIEALCLGSGSRSYRLDLLYVPDTGQTRLSCSCPAFLRETPCKHLWALLLHAERIGLLGEWQVKAVDWQSRLQRVGQRLPNRLTISDPWSLRREVKKRYEFQLSFGPAARGPLEVRLIEYKTKKNGSFGVGRLKTVTTHFLNSMEDLELRERLKFLKAAVLANRDYWYSSDSLAVFPIPDGQARSVIQSLVSAENCRLQTDDDSPGPLLELSEAPPLSFQLRWLDDPDFGAEVFGELVSAEGDTTLPLDEVTALHSCGYVITDEIIQDVDWNGAMPIVEELFVEGPMSVPGEELSEFREKLSMFPELPFDLQAWSGSEALDLQGGAESGGNSASVKPIPYLFVESPDMGDKPRWGDLRCRVDFEYLGFRVNARDPKISIYDEQGTPRCTRDLAAERAFIAKLLNVGAKPVQRSWRNEHHDAMIKPTDFNKVVVSLVDEGWVVEAEGLRYRSGGTWRTTISSGVDWFDLEVALEFEDGQVAAWPALLEAVSTGRKTIRLGDGSTGLLPDQWLEQFNLVSGLGKTEGDAIRVQKNQAWVLDALLASRDDVMTDASFTAFRNKIRTLPTLGPKKERRGFRGTLRPYQREGLGWMQRLGEVGVGGCLADDMGLGKTVQVLSLLDHRHARRTQGIPPSLVVAPRSVIFNWLSEAERFAPRLRVLDYTGTQRKERLAQHEEVDLWVTTYGTLRNDIVELSERSFSTLILDESQTIKNGSSQVAKAARLLRAEHRLALSGTPIENHLSELWSLFEFLNPGMLGRSSSFKRLVGKDGAVKDPTSRSVLSTALRPFILRRTKEQVLPDLPSKTEQLIECELSGKGLREYRELAHHYRAALQGTVEEQGLGKSKIQILEALLRLRQAACHPALIDQSRVGESSPKIDALIPMLQEIADSGHKALVFSQFTKLLAIVKDRLDQAGIGYEYLDGRTRKRKDKVEKFQTNADCHAFLISLKAGGVGLNLTAASYVFILDPWWNPAAESQAIDRAHRIGQENPVVVYRLITRDTVEEKVRELQDSKRDLAAAVIGNDNAVLRDLRSEDLALLLS